MGGLDSGSVGTTLTFDSVHFLVTTYWTTCSAQMFLAICLDGPVPEKVSPSICNSQLGNNGKIVFERNQASSALLKSKFVALFYAFMNCSLHGVAEFRIFMIGSNIDFSSKQLPYARHHKPLLITSRS
jgi:hypothetical protein